MATTKTVVKPPFPNSAFAPLAANGRLGTTKSISLPGAMTAGYGVEDGTYQNPLPVPGTYGGNPKWGPERIGVIRTIPGVAPNSGPTKQFSLYFIFNPSEIDISFGINQSAIPANYTGGTPNIVQNQTVRWSLVFDRTYDFLYDAHPGEDRGVLKDVGALYNVVGAFSTGGTPVSYPVQVIFARTTKGQLWGFTGFISAIAVTYGIFRANMIPSHAEVDISIQAVYINTEAPAGGGGGSTVKGNPSATHNFISKYNAGKLNASNFDVTTPQGRAAFARAVEAGKASGPV